MKLRSLLVPLALVACSSDKETPASPPSSGPDCPEGFDGTRGFCTEIVSAEACPGGTRPAIGSAKCVPVGWTNCPDSFAPAEGGWGCTDLAIQTACPPDKRETFNADCVNIGSCSNPFPPAGALIVDDDFTPAQIDATHFKTIQAAVAAATPGATIAIERGVYAEDVKLTKDVKLVGRCATDVRIDPTSSSDPGIVTEGAKDVEIRGLTVVGHVGGISIFNGANAKIEEVIVRDGKSFGIIVDQSAASIKRSKVMDTVVFDNRGGWGVSAGGKADVQLDEVNVVGGTTGVYAGTTDATMTVIRSAISMQAPQSPIRSSGIYSRGGRITVERSLVHDVTGDSAVGVELPKGIVEVRNSVMRTIKVGGTLARGYGAIAFNGGELTVRDSAVIGAESVGLAARDSGAILSAYGTVVRGPPKSSAKPNEDREITSEGAGIGVQTAGKAQVSLDDCAVIEPWGWGVYGDTGGTIDVKHSLIHAVRVLQAGSTPFGIGVAVSGGSVTLDDLSITKTTNTALVAGKKGSITGKKLYVRDVAASTPAGSGITVGESGTIDLEGSAIVEATVMGVLATRGSESSVRLVGSTIHGTRAVGEGFGHGAVVVKGAQLHFEKTAIYDNTLVGVVANGGRVHLLGAVVAKNVVGIQAQEGSFIVESADTGDLTENELRVSPDSRFLDNGTRVGIGETPLPRNVIE